MSWERISRKSKIVLFYYRLTLMWIPTHSSLFIIILLNHQWLASQIIYVLRLSAWFLQLTVLILGFATYKASNRSFTIHFAHLPALNFCPNWQFVPKLHHLSLISITDKLNNYSLCFTYILLHIEHRIQKILKIFFTLLFAFNFSSPTKNASVLSIF